MTKANVPTACIRSTDGITCCNREYDQKYEYVFIDRVHAVQHYADGKYLRACSDCVAALKAIASSDGGDNLAPMATRGLKNSR